MTSARRQCQSRLATLSQPSESRLTAAWQPLRCCFAADVLLASSEDRSLGEDGKGRCSSPIASPPVFSPGSCRGVGGPLTTVTNASWRHTPCEIVRRAVRDEYTAPAKNVSSNALRLSPPRVQMYASVVKWGSTMDEALRRSTAFVRGCQTGLLFA